MHVLLDLYGVLLDHEKMFRGYRERLAELLSARFGGAPEAWRRAHDEAWVTYLQRVNSVDWESRGYADIVDELDARHLLEIFDRVGVAGPPADASPCRGNSNGRRCPASTRDTRMHVPQSSGSDRPDTGCTWPRAAARRTTQRSEARACSTGLIGSSRAIRRTRRKDSPGTGKRSPISSESSPRTVSSWTTGSTISRPPPRSESWRSCWTGRPRTDRSPCHCTWKRPSATSRDSRTGSNSGSRRDRIESGPGRRLARRASVPLLRGIFGVNPFERLWSHALQLHVAHAIPDFAEEDLLLHPVSEPDRPADFRPRAAVAFRDDVHEILRVVRLRVALVGAEVGAVLEAGLRDDAAAREILVRLQAEFEVRLDRLRLLDEPRKSDRTVRVRVPYFDEPGLQQVRRLEEAELQPTPDDLPEETGVVERLRLDLIDHDRAVPEKVDDDLGLPEGGRWMPAGVCLPDAVVRQIALFIHEPEEERLPDRRRFLRPPEEFRQVEHRTFAQRSHPIFARRLLRRAAPRIHLEIEGSAAGLDDVAAGPQVAVHEVANLERGHRSTRGPEQLPGGHRPPAASHLEPASLDEVHRLQEIQLEAASGSRGAEEPAVVDPAPFRGVVDDHAVVEQFPRHRGRRRPGPR